MANEKDNEFIRAMEEHKYDNIVLAELDLLDSRIYEMREAVSAVKTDEFSARMWALDNRKLYKHDRKSIDEDTKLF